MASAANHFEDGVNVSEQDLIKIKVKKMREEREARQAARLQALKNLNLKRVPRESIYLGISQKDEKPKLVNKSNLLPVKTNSESSKVVSGEIKSSINTEVNTSRSKKIHSMQNRKSLAPQILQSNNEKVSNGFPTSNKPSKQNMSNSRKSTVPEPISKNVSKYEIKNSFTQKNIPNVRQSIAQSTLNTDKNNTKRFTNSTIERLAKPKTVDTKKTLTTTKKSTGGAFSKKFFPRKSIMPKIPIIQKKVENFAEKSKLRRSLSTVHFKKLGPEAAQSCIKRTLSMGNITHKEIEEEIVEFPPKNYILPVGSEKKKSVTFFSPLRKDSGHNLCLNTPKPSELRKRLNDWLQKRGKSLSTYHHLKCFGLKLRETPPAILEMPDDEENKENVEVLDDESFREDIAGEVRDNAAVWRRASTLSECSETTQPSPNKGIRESLTRNVTPREATKDSVDPLISDALYDLNLLILEDYSWLQCAEWLRLIVKECGENVKNIAAYWECRAALEEKRGDFVRTVDCFNNALQHGAQKTNIEESLDKLLEKFMKLNLDPQCDLQPPEQKLVNAKNVFKSSLIKFAIKRQTNEINANDGFAKKKYVATPVRRSTRISTVNSHTFVPSPQINDDLKKKNINDTLTPENKKKIVNKINSSAKQSGRKHLVQLCDSLRNMDENIKKTLIFVPNKALNFDN